jgi:hypothetical protein
MQLTLTEPQAATLRKILVSYLGDLRFEISGTDKMDFREHLKKEEVFIKELIGQLPAEPAA